MCTHCTSPAECVTWDDVCEWWDNGVYTTEDVRLIAYAYFEGAELSAVLEEIEKVASHSDASPVKKADPGIHLEYWREGRKQAA